MTKKEWIGDPRPSWLCQTMGEDIMKKGFKRGSREVVYKDKETRGRKNYIYYLTQGDCTLEGDVKYLSELLDINPNSIGNAYRTQNKIRGYTVSRNDLMV